MTDLEDETLIPHKKGRTQTRTRSPPFLHQGSSIVNLNFNSTTQGIARDASFYEAKKNVSFNLKS